MRLRVPQLECELHLGVVARVAYDLLYRVLVLRLGELVPMEIFKFIKGISLCIESKF